MDNRMSVSYFLFEEKVTKENFRILNALEVPQPTSRKFRCVESIINLVIDSNAPKFEPTGLSRQPSSQRIRQLGAVSNLKVTIKTRQS